MPTTPPPSEVDIARRAQEMKLLFLGTMLTLPSLFDPALPVLRWELARLGTPADGDCPVVLKHQRDDAKALEFSMREILTKVTRLRGEAVGHDLLSVTMLLGGIRLGDMIVQGQHSKSDVPLLQFARHFRNACAHGDRWNFAKNQPEHPAACRDTVLTAALHGQRATYDIVSPRRYVEFLDDLSNYFLPGSVPAPTVAD
jgi:hypothetical protein